MRRPVGDVIMGLDLSLTGSAAVVLPGWWSPSEPWSGVVAHRFGEEGKLGGHERRSAIVNGVWRLAVRTGVKWVFVEEHSFGKGLMKHAFARAELVGAVKESLWHSLRIEPKPVVASGARKLLFGPQQRMASKEWKRYIGARFAELGSSLMSEDERDAMVVANGGRYALELPCMSTG